MTAATINLTSQFRRQQAADLCFKAPLNCTVEFRENKRTIPQNARFHAMCLDVARQVVWQDIFGRPFKMSQESWKRFFLRMYQQEALVVPNEEGTAFFDLGVSSSKLRKKDFMDLIEIVQAFGARRGVQFRDPKSPDAHSPESKEVA